MLEGHRVVLKRGMKVGLGKMPCVARFRKKAQISKSQLLNQVPAFRQSLLVIIKSKARVDEEKATQYQNTREENDQESG